MCIFIIAAISSTQNVSPMMRSEIFVWPEAFQHWSLQVVGWALVLVPKWGPPGELTPIIFPGGATILVLVLNLSW